MHPVLLYIVYIENLSRPEEVNDNYGKMTNIWIMGGGFTVCEKDFKSKFKNCT